MRVVCISDTHTLAHPATLPDGDVLIHAGDFSIDGSVTEIRDSLEWFFSQPHRHKVWIGGNHDAWLDLNPIAFDKFFAEETSHYLRDSLVVIQGLRFYGSPVSRSHGRIQAFAKQGADLFDHWLRIPSCDVLITHGPPFGIRDMTAYKHKLNNNLGDEGLLMAVQRIKPKLHVFGHIHGGYGVHYDHTIFVNASQLDETYDPSNEPIVVDI